MGGFVSIVKSEPAVRNETGTSRIEPYSLSRKTLRIAMIGQKGLPATYGGIENHVENLSVGLAQRGHRVTVFCRPYYSADLANNPQIEKSINGEYLYKNINLQSVRSLKTKHFDAITHSAISAAIASRTDFDIIHFHGIGPALLSFVPGLTGKKVVATVHALDYRQKKWGWFAKGCLRAGLKSATTFPQKTICVSQTITDLLGNCNNLVNIPNGVKDPFVWGKGELEWIMSQGLTPGKYILFVGRLIEDKGCHLLCRAVREIGNGLKLAIAGDSSFTDSYVAELKHIAGNETIFLGNVYNENLSALYANSALFVLPSSVEGLPIVLIEAMKHRAPVLASDIPENMDVLNSNDGFLPIGTSFKNGNVQDLKDKINECLSRPRQLNQMVERAIKVVDNDYNWNNIVKKTEDVYFDVLEKGGHSNSNRENQTGKLSDNL